MTVTNKQFKTILTISVFTVMSSISLPGTAQHISNMQNGQSTTLGSLTTGGQITVSALSGTQSVAGHDIDFQNFSGVLGQSSDTAYIMVARGKVSSAGAHAKRGQVLILTPIQGKVIVQRYDAARFIKSWPEATRQNGPELLADFKAVAKTQKWALFLGRYESTEFNVAAPGSPSTELARRSIIGADVISRIRFSGETDPQVLEQRIVKTFTGALANGDAKTVASLMDPSPFGRSDLRGGGDGARLLMARQLVASQDWARRLRGAQFSRGNDGVWRIDSSGTRTQIILKPIGDFAFIQSINTQS